MGHEIDPSAEATSGADVTELQDRELEQICGGGVRASWVAYECWPKSWKVNGFDGKGNDVVTEEVVFVTENIERG